MKLYPNAHASGRYGPFMQPNPYRHMPGSVRVTRNQVSDEFRSRILQKLIEPLFAEAVRRMVAAFEARAGKLYGVG